jgi:hypothetical protein
MVMNKTNLIIIGLLAISSTSLADAPLAVTHWEFQAVHADGSSSFDDSGPWHVVLEGILLNNPEKWLDPTADPTVEQWFMGGEWELFVQGEGDDHAGTACWMGQNYGNGPGDENYTNEEWLSEICRLNHDPNTRYVFRAGDRIRVTGTYLFYAGKLNINENHEVDPFFDFKVELVKPAVGLPQPEEISISDLKDASNNDIFDSNRLTGGEYYQSRLVRIEDANIIDPENWEPGKTVTITDSSGRTFPVLLCLGAGISRYDCPTGKIDVVGILDQKGAGYPPDATKGYRLLVLDYDGNGLMLGDTGHLRGNLPGDTNNDYIVDLKDFAELAGNWLENRAGLYGCYP